MRACLRTMGRRAVHGSIPLRAMRSMREERWIDVRHRRTYLDRFALSQAYTGTPSRTARVLPFMARVSIMTRRWCDVDVEIRGVAARLGVPVLPWRRAFQRARKVPESFWWGLEGLEACICQTMRVGWCSLVRVTVSESSANYLVTRSRHARTIAIPQSQTRAYERRIDSFLYSSLLRYIPP